MGWGNTFWDHVRHRRASRSLRPRLLAIGGRMPLVRVRICLGNKLLDYSSSEECDLREQTQENVADGQLWSLDRLFDKTGIPDNEVTMKRQVFKSLLDKMVAEGILKKQGELYQEGKRSHHA